MQMRTHELYIVHGSCFITCAFGFCVSNYNGYKRNVILSYNALINLQLFLRHCHDFKDPYLRILVLQGPVFYL